METKKCKIKENEGNGEGVDCACAQHENAPQRTAKGATKAEIPDEITKCTQLNKEDEQNDVTPSTRMATPVSYSVTVPGRGTVETAGIGQIASNISPVGRLLLPL